MWILHYQRGKDSRHEPTHARSEIKIDYLLAKIHMYVKLT